MATLPDLTTSSTFKSVTLLWQDEWVNEVVVVSSANDEYRFKYSARKGGWKTLSSGNLYVIRQIAATTNKFRDSEGDSVSVTLYGCPYTTDYTQLEELGYANPLDNGSHNRIVARKRSMFGGLSRDNTSLFGPIYRRTNSPTHPGTPTGGSVTAVGGVVTAPDDWSKDELEPTATEQYVYVSFVVFVSETDWSWLTPWESSRHQTTATVADSHIKGAWDATITYEQGDIITSNGTLCMLSPATSLNQAPETNPTVWIRIRNDAVPWRATSTYTLGTHVSLHGKLYVLKVATATGIDPSLTNQTSWVQIGGPAATHIEGILTRNSTEILSNDEYTLATDDNATLLSAANVPAVSSSRFDDRLRIESGEFDETLTVVWLTVEEVADMTASDTYVEANSVLLYTGSDYTVRAFKLTNGNLALRKVGGSGTLNYEAYIDHIYFTESMDRVQEALQDIVSGSPALKTVKTELGRATGINTQQGLEKVTNASLPTASGLDERIKVLARSPAGSGAWTVTWLDRSTLDGWTRNNSPLQASRLAVISAGSGNLELFINSGEVFRLYASSTGAGVSLSYDIIIERYQVIEGFDRVEEAVAAIARTVYTPTEKARLAAMEDEATADQTGAEIRDALAGLTGTNRLDAGAIKNIPGAALEGFEKRETILRADASSSFGTGTFITPGFNKPTSRVAGSYADVFRFEFTRNNVTTIKRVPQQDIANLPERTNHSDAGARITLLSDSGFEIYLWSRQGSLPNSLRVSSPALTARTYNLEIVREEYHYTSAAVHTALNNATATEPYLIGRVFKAASTASYPGRPTDGNGDGSASQGVVTKTGVTTAPTGYTTTEPTPWIGEPWTFASDCIGYEVNGVLYWKWSPVYIYNRNIQREIYRSAWSATVEYFTAEIVAHHGVLWMCLAGSVTGTEPTTDDTVWTRIVHGSLQWSSTTVYERGLIVHKSDAPNILYICLVASSEGTDPASDGQTHWLRLGFIPDGTIAEGKLHATLIKKILPDQTASTSNQVLISGGAGGASWALVALANLASDITGRLLPSAGTTGRALLKTAAGWATGQLGSDGIANDAVLLDKLAAAVRQRLIPGGGSTNQVLRKTSNNDYSLGWAAQTEGNNPIPSVSGLTVVYDRQTSLVAPGSVPSGRVQFYNSTGAGGTGTRSLLNTYASLLSATGGLGNTLNNSRYMQLGAHESDKRSSVGSKTAQYTNMLMNLWGYAVPVLIYWADDRWILYSGSAAGNSQAVRDASNINVRLNSVQAFNLSGVSNLNDTIDNTDIIVKWGFAPDLDTTYALSHSDTYFRRVAVGSADPTAPTAQWTGSNYTGSLNSFQATVPGGTDPLWIAVARATRAAGGAWGSTTWTVYPATDADNPFFDARYSTNPAGPFTSTTPISVGYAQITVEGGTKLVVPIGQTGQYTGAWTRLLTNDHVDVSTEGNINLANNINLHDFNEVYFDFGVTSGSNGEGPVIIRADEIKVINYHTHIDHKNAILSYHSDYGTGIVFGRNPNDALPAGNDDQAFLRLAFRRPLGEDGVGTRFGAIDVDAVSFGTGTTPVLSIYAR